ncbi:MULTISPECIES: hypothetical protein [Paraburkholderia]|uniref:hypothetical protein n=1 Tax=Paraburkholderia TaxID=1822464 RepID=UPI0038B90D99
MNSQQKTSTLASIAGAVIALLLAFGSPLSQGASPDVDAHGHGAGASQGAKASKAQPKSLSDADTQMKKMQEIHERMMAAKTPEERAKLMDEQMQAMQQGMAMMNGMKNPHGSMGPNGMRHDMMEKRMDMMQMMMTMMMDRQSIENAPAAK